MLRPALNKTSTTNPFHQALISRMHRTALNTELELEMGSIWLQCHHFHQCSTSDSLLETRFKHPVPCLRPERGHALTWPKLPSHRLGEGGARPSCLADLWLVWHRGPPRDSAHDLPSGRLDEGVSLHGLIHAQVGMQLVPPRTMLLPLSTSCVDSLRSTRFSDTAFPGLRPSFWLRACRS